MTMSKAFEKLVKYLSIRDHSEAELTTKLSQNFADNEIREALEIARTKKLMKTPEELTEQVYEELCRKDKGALYIAKYLEAKGLPELKIDSEQEVERARKLVMAKLKIDRLPNEEAKLKIFRLLTNRGFDEETIRTIANEQS